MIIQYSSNVLENDESTLNGIKVVHQRYYLIESFYEKMLQQRENQLTDIPSELNKDSNDIAHEN